MDPGQEQNVSEGTAAAIQRCIRALVHATQCRDVRCSLTSCQKMKRVVAHTKICRRKGVCPICKQLIALCCHHAKWCQATECAVPFCGAIKEKLQQRNSEPQAHDPNNIGDVATDALAHMSQEQLSELLVQLNIN